MTPLNKKTLANTGTNGDSERRGTKQLVLLLLSIEAGLLAYSSSLHSPTYLEPAFLVSGIAHWEFCRFEPYRVNPPLVRMLAAAPALAVGYQSDWSSYYEGPGARAEFRLGTAFIKANGSKIVSLIQYGRWACIPFSLLGAYFAYRWAAELYGPNAGLLTLVLFVFEPNLLAHGELITPDTACVSFGIVAAYTFWRWLRAPTWKNAFIAGGCLGLAELSKTIWLILFGLWWFLWFAWRILTPKACLSSALQANNSKITSPSAQQLLAIQALAIYLINLGYGFDGSGTLLKDFQFVSKSLSGREVSGDPGNRFCDSFLGNVPMPVPSQYVLGIDLQKKDFEGFPHQSYLCGKWSDHGWWYYYLYGLAVKVPCGTWLLFAVVLMLRLHGKSRPVPLRDELVLISPAIALLVLVSSQTAFSIHLRYVFPTLGLMLIFVGQAAKCISNTTPVKAGLVTSLLLYTVGSSLLAYPNHFAYFNEFVGGPKNGHRHLLGSSLDWGQGLIEAINWIQEHEPEADVRFEMWSNDLANVLFNHKTAIVDGNPSSLNTKKKVILYSAEYFNRHNKLPMVRDMSESVDSSHHFSSGLVATLKNN
jgi:hypothetical protein